MSKDILDQIAENVPTTTDSQRDVEHNRVQEQEFDQRDMAEYDGAWDTDH